MRNRKLINRIAAVGGAVCLALTLMTSPVTTISVQAAASSNEEILPMHAVIQWRYKIVDGNLYRRLYNYQINAWVGEWEYIGPYNP